MEKTRAWSNAGVLMCVLVVVSTLGVATYARSSAPFVGSWAKATLRIGSEPRVFASGHVTQAHPQPVVHMPVSHAVGAMSETPLPGLATKCLACLVGTYALARPKQHRIQTRGTSAVEVPTKTVDPNVPLGMCAAVLVMVAVGSPFTWSVFLQPIQMVMGLSRAKASLTFSLYLFWFAIGVWRTGVEMGKYPTPQWTLMTLLLGGAGLLYAGVVGTFAALLSGFSIMGIATGMGYGFAVQVAALSKRRGLCTGIVLSAFATAPVFLLPFVKAAVAAGGPLKTFCQLGGCLMTAAPVAFLTTKLAGVQLAKPSAGAGSVSDTLSVFGRIFAAFFFASFAGLMFFGHATGIMAVYGVKNLASGVTGMALGNWSGRLISGLFIDKLGSRKVLLAGSMGTALACSGMLLSSLVPPRLVVAIVGAGYGFALTGFAALTAELYGKARFGTIYGKAFVAYGLAGLSSSWLAGKIFDLFGTYVPTLKIVVVLSLASAVLVNSLPKKALA
mmetsp:Transcript_75419/g.161596  ORF Transcript_75419/g.161596 Transcript_75419/m.161596 type:complete len:501 (+) Transcript_75419:59-1561(+)